MKMPIFLVICFSWYSHFYHPKTRKSGENTDNQGWVFERQTNPANGKENLPIQLTFDLQVQFNTKKYFAHKQKVNIFPQSSKMNWRRKSEKSNGTNMKQVVVVDVERMKSRKSKKNFRIFFSFEAKQFVKPFIPPPSLCYLSNLLLSK